MFRKSFHSLSRTRLIWIHWRWSQLFTLPCKRWHLYKCRIHRKPWNTSPVTSGNQWLKICIVYFKVFANYVFRTGLQQMLALKTYPPIPTPKLLIPTVKCWRTKEHSLASVKLVKIWSNSAEASVTEIRIWPRLNKLSQIHYHTLSLHVCILKSTFLVLFCFFSISAHFSQSKSTFCNCDKNANWRKEAPQI